ncbi:unnamed protein product [Cyprideis torosa]|uniref:Uncharacterized protein n=1 Tax=Cyprideis torosa TaxID=163714 RepID=A0A7R8W951_9CRUS|nr:unnamed protein product [Cyprideis torosa]CAG0889374.1 unnamed protein product [Cyprideis torosa]
MVLWMTLLLLPSLADSRWSLETVERGEGFAIKKRLLRIKAVPDSTGCDGCDTLQGDLLASASQQGDTLQGDLASASQQGDTLQGDLASASQQGDTLQGDLASASQQGDTLQGDLLASASQQGDSVLVVPPPEDLVATASEADETEEVASDEEVEDEENEDDEVEDEENEDDEERGKLSPLKALIQQSTQDKNQEERRPLFKKRRRKGLSLFPSLDLAERLKALSPLQSNAADKEDEENEEEEAENKLPSRPPLFKNSELLKSLNEAEEEADTSENKLPSRPPLFKNSELLKSLNEAEEEADTSENKLPSRPSLFKNSELLKSLNEAEEEADTSENKLPLRPSLFKNSELLKSLNEAEEEADTSENKLPSRPSLFKNSELLKSLNEAEEEAEEEADTSENKLPSRPSLFKSSALLKSLNALEVTTAKSTGCRFSFLCPKERKEEEEEVTEEEEEITVTPSSESPSSSSTTTESTTTTTAKVDALFRGLAARRKAKSSLFFSRRTSKAPATIEESSTTPSTSESTTPSAPTDQEPSTKAKELVIVPEEQSNAQPGPFKFIPRKRRTKSSSLLQGLQVRLPSDDYLAPTSSDGTTEATASPTESSSATSTASTSSKPVTKAVKDPQESLNELAEEDLQKATRAPPPPPPPPPPRRRNSKLFGGRRLNLDKILSESTSTVETTTSSAAPTEASEKTEAEEDESSTIPTTSRPRRTSPRTSTSRPRPIIRTPTTGTSPKTTTSTVDSAVTGSEQQSAVVPDVDEVVPLRLPRDPSVPNAGSEVQTFSTSTKRSVFSRTPIKPDFPPIAPKSKLDSVDECEHPYHSYLCQRRLGFDPVIKPEEEAPGVTDDQSDVKASTERTTTSDEVGDGEEVTTTQGVNEEEVSTISTEASSPTTSTSSTSASTSATTAAAQRRRPAFKLQLRTSGPVRRRKKILSVSPTDAPDAPPAASSTTELAPIRRRTNRVRVKALERERQHADNRYRAKCQAGSRSSNLCKVRKKIRRRPPFESEGNQAATSEASNEDISESEEASIPEEEEGNLSRAGERRPPPQLRRRTTVRRRPKILKKYLAFKPRQSPQKVHQQPSSTSVTTPELTTTTVSPSAETSTSVITEIRRQIQTSSTEADLSEEPVRSSSSSLESSSIGTSSSSPLPTTSTEDPSTTTFEPETTAAEEEEEVFATTFTESSTPPSSSSSTVPSTTTFRFPTFEEARRLRTRFTTPSSIASFNRRRSSTEATSASTEEPLKPRTILVEGKATHRAQGPRNRFKTTIKDAYDRFNPWNNPKHDGLVISVLRGHYGSKGVVSATTEHPFPSTSFPSHSIYFTPPPEFPVTPAASAEQPSRKPQTLFLVDPATQKPEFESPSSEAEDELLDEDDSLEMLEGGIFNSEPADIFLGTRFKSADLFQGVPEQKLKQQFIVPPLPPVSQGPPQPVTRKPLRYSKYTHFEANKFEDAYDRKKPLIKQRKIKKISRRPQRLRTRQRLLVFKPPQVDTKSTPIPTTPSTTTEVPLSENDISRDLPGFNFTYPSPFQMFAQHRYPVASAGLSPDRAPESVFSHKIRFPESGFSQHRLPDTDFFKVGTSLTSTVPSAIVTTTTQLTTTETEHPTTVPNFSDPVPFGEALSDISKESFEFERLKKEFADDLKSFSEFPTSTEQATQPEEQQPSSNPGFQVDQPENRELPTTTDPQESSPQEEDHGAQPPTEGSQSNAPPRTHSQRNPPNSQIQRGPPEDVSQTFPNFPQVIITKPSRVPQRPPAVFFPQQPNRQPQHVPRRKFHRPLSVISVKALNRPYPRKPVKQLRTSPQPARKSHPLNPQPPQGSQPFNPQPPEGSQPFNPQPAQGPQPNQASPQQQTTRGSFPQPVQGSVPVFHRNQGFSFVPQPVTETQSLSRPAPGLHFAPKTLQGLQPPSLPVQPPSQSVQGFQPSQPISQPAPGLHFAPKPPFQPLQGFQPSQPIQGFKPSQPNQGFQSSQPNQGFQPSQPNQGFQPSQPVQGFQPPQPAQPFNASPSPELLLNSFPNSIEDEENETPVPTTTPSTTSTQPPFANSPSPHLSIIKVSPSPPHVLQDIRNSEEPFSVRVSTPAALHRIRTPPPPTRRVQTGTFSVLTHPAGLSGRKVDSDIIVSHEDLDTEESPRIHTKRAQREQETHGIQRQESDSGVWFQTRNHFLPDPEVLRRVLPTSDAQALNFYNIPVEEMSMDILNNLTFESKKIKT